jgi:hypothetical protein
MGRIKNLALRYPANEESDILPFTVIAGIPFLSRQEIKLGHSSVSAMMNKEGFRRLITFLTIKLMSNGR